MMYAKIDLSDDSIVTIDALPNRLQNLSNASLADMAAALDPCPAEFDGYGYWPVTEVNASIGSEEVNDTQNPNDSVDAENKTVTRTYPAVTLGGGRLAALRASKKVTRKAAIDTQRDAFLNSTGTTIDGRKYTRNEVLGVVQAHLRLQSWGAGGAKVITDITKADPVALTVPAHSMTSGVFGRVSGIVGMTELNDSVYEVVRTGAGSMTLKHADTGRAINTTEMTTYVSGGTITPVARVITGDNHVLYKTLSETEGLSNSLTAWYENFYAAGRRHKSAVDALTTSAEIGGYDSSAWPS